MKSDTKKMVYYFKSRCGNFTIYMGKDKYENEDLIRYGELRISMNCSFFLFVALFSQVYTPPAAAGGWRRGRRRFWKKRGGATAGEGGGGSGEDGRRRGRIGFEVGGNW